MIQLSELNQLAQKFQVPTEVIEKDYIISWILCCLSTSSFKDAFVFYGGTAIKRIYFEEHRFSEDIDLISTKKFSLDYIVKELVCLEYAKAKANLALEINRSKIITIEHRFQIYVNYDGFEEIVGAPKEIRLDFVTDTESYGKSLGMRMIESYSDLKGQNIKLSAMSLNSILANKIGLLFDLTRNEPRDLFDIWFLLQRIDQFAYNYNELCDEFKAKFGFRPSKSTIISRLNNPSIDKKWAIRLSKQLPQLPSVQTVKKEITVFIEKLFQ